MADQTRGKHPKGLPYLFLTEMWERFGYYLIIGIFVLYMIDSEKGGLALDDRVADDIFGTFIALTYLTPFLGGFLADRVLGYINSIYLGGILMGLGYIGLGVFQAQPLFYLSLGLIILGNGFFKPSISTLLGNLYNDERYIANKDAGYNIFYMGINIGAFVCNIIAAFMRNKYGWGPAFISAGAGMFLGLVIFTLGRRHILAANVKKAVVAGDTKLSDILVKVFLPAVVAGGLGWIIPSNIFGSDSTDAFIFACIPVIFFYVNLWFKAKNEERRSIGALLAIFAVSLMFWAVFKQNGTALTRWANYYTERTVPPAADQPLKTLYLTEEKSYAPKEVSVYDEQYQTVKGEDGKVKKTTDRDIYFRNISAEQKASLEQNPEQNISLYNTELFQSINPFWVIVLTPAVVGAFMYLRRRGKEPSTPAKMVLGLFISALSCLVMVLAVKAGDNGAVKVSAWWLIATYGVITVGELCLSPMGLSLVSKLSPPRLTALMMGGFFLSTAIGNKLSGVLASFWYDYEDKSNFFWVNFGLLLLATAVGLSILKPLNRIMREQNVK